MAPHVNRGNRRYLPRIIWQIYDIMMSSIQEFPSFFTIVGVYQGLLRKSFLHLADFCLANTPSRFVSAITIRSFSDSTLSLARP